MAPGAAAAGGGEAAGVSSVTGDGSLSGRGEKVPRGSSVPPIDKKANDLCGIVMGAYQSAFKRHRGGTAPNPTSAAASAAAPRPPAAASLQKLRCDRERGPPRARRMAPAARLISRAVS